MLTVKNGVSAHQGLAQPAPAFFMNDTVMPSVWTRLKALRPYFLGTQWAFVLSGLAALVSGLCEGGIAWLMQPLVDKGMKQAGFPLWLIPIGLIVLFAVRGVTGFVVNYTLAWAANKATLIMRSRMFERLLNAHPSLFSARAASSLINTVVYEVLGGVMQLVSAAQVLLKDSFTVLVLLVMLVYLNWQLTLFIALLVPTVGYTMQVFGKRMRTLTKEAQLVGDKLAYVVEENVLAWRVVRLHGAQAEQKSRFTQASTAAGRLMMKSTVASSIITPVTQFMTACALAAVITVVLWQSNRNGMSIGSFIAFITAVIAIAQPMRRLTDLVGPVSRGLASIERGMELIHDVRCEIGGTHAPGRSRGVLSLINVSMHFGEADKPSLALNKVTMHIAAGETLALVGPSGAGKTTLVNLLPRFLDPSAGEVCLDGVPLPDWDLKALRAQFAFVSQDLVLFNDSVAANVCFGAPLDAQRVQNALVGANLAGFVQGLPQGAQTLIGHNGTQLSGGQRQRLAIARAIYKDAPILILDEATSALDSESERLVQQALEGLMQGRTSVVIAHRLSTIEHASRIVVLNEGQVAEQGPHRELLQNGGLYARLHALQFKNS
jgi:ATP-binding cassette, subfamily B, bacterial MsbA